MTYGSSISTQPFKLTPFKVLADCENEDWKVRKRNKIKIVKLEDDICEKEKKKIYPGWVICWIKDKKKLVNEGEGIWWMSRKEIWNWKDDKIVKVKKIKVKIAWIHILMYIWDDVIWESWIREDSERVEIIVSSHMKIGLERWWNRDILGLNQWW